VLYIRPHSGHIGFCCWWSSKGEPPSSDTGPGSPGHVYQFEHPPYSKLVKSKTISYLHKYRNNSCSYLSHYFCWHIRSWL
jgi:hypothetical protein